MSKIDYNELVEFVRTHDEYYVAEFMFADNKRIVELKQDLEFTTKTANDLIEIKHKLEQQLAEKDKEIEDLKKWQDWYSMWHKKFQKQIEDLTTELETYRPTKLHGNGQCKCFNCNAINWTDWCSQYKGHIYCNKCLKDILKEEQTPQTQLAIQELEKVKMLTEWKFESIADVVNQIDQQIKELKGEKDVKD